MMNSRAVPVVVAAVVMFSGIARAETMAFPEHNFAIDLPAGWTKTDPVGASLAAVTNPDGQKLFVIVAVRIPENERDTAISSMSSGAKEALQGKGWTVNAGRKVSINGVDFEVLNGQGPDAGVTMSTLIALVGNEGYSFQAFHKSGNAESDPEFQSILRSFRLLSQANAVASPAKKNSASYRLGYLAGQTCTCVVLPLLVVIGVVWFIRRRRANQRTHVVTPPRE